LRAVSGNQISVLSQAGAIEPLEINNYRFDPAGETNHIASLVDFTPLQMQPTAVMVATVIVTNGLTPHLAATLATVRAQTRPSDQIILVDTVGNTGRLGEQPLAGLDLTAVTVLPPRRISKSASGAVSQAIEFLNSVGAPADWLWLLHDDSAPDPTALEELLRATEHSGATAVAGCKQRGWPAAAGEPGALLEVGHTISPFGRRVTGIEPGEVDQGQYDDKSDVLAVDFAGALVSTRMWEQLGGLDGAFGTSGGDTDFCRRAWRSGARVVVVPSAVMYHAQCERRTRRRIAVYRNQRLSNELHRLIHASGWALLPILLTSLLFAPFLALSRLAAGHPNQATSEAILPLLVFARLRVVLRSRGRLSRSAVVPNSVLHPLLPGWRTSWQRWRDMYRQQAIRAGAPPALNQLELQAQAARARQLWAGFAVMVALTIGLTAALFGPISRDLLAGNRLVGGGLLPAPGTFAQAWAAATTQTLVGGFFGAAPADPLLVVLAGLTALTRDAQLTVHLLFLAAFPIAGIGAWFAAGAFTRSVLARLVAALGWACAPVLTAALSGGQLGNVLVHLTLPFFIWAAARALGFGSASYGSAGFGSGPGGNRHPSTTALGVAALLLAVLVAAAPALLGLAVIGALLVALLVPRARYFGVAALLPAAVVGGPLWAFVARNPAAWPILFELPVAPTAVEAAVAPEPWQAFLGNPTTPDAWLAMAQLPAAVQTSQAAPIIAAVIAALPYVGAGLIVLLALSALFRKAHFGAARVLAILIAITFAFSLFTSHIGYFPMAAISIGWALVGALALLATGQAGPTTPVAASGLPSRATSQIRARAMVSLSVARIRKVLAVLLIVVALAGSGVWLATSPLTVPGGVTVAEPVVPTVGLTLQEGGGILHLNRTEAGVLEYSILRANGTTIFETSVAANYLAGRSEVSEAQLRVEQAVATLSAGSAASAEAVQVLAEFGIGAVQVPATGNLELETALGLVPGFVRLTEDSGPIIWRLDLPESANWAAALPAVPAYPNWAIYAGLGVLGVFALMALPIPHGDRERRVSAASAKRIVVPTEVPLLYSDHAGRHAEGDPWPAGADSWPADGESWPAQGESWPADGSALATVDPLLPTDGTVLAFEGVAL
jgi:hypothetical protein